MNLAHRLYCRSARWRRAVNERILPWVLDGVDDAVHVLEIGPGPGLTTEVLRDRFDRLTAIEVDAPSAAALAERLHGTGVTVRHGDGAAMPFDDRSFDGVLALTMLHHVPSPELQDQLLAEAARVLVPGGWFAGCDSRTSLPFRLLHLGDTMVMVDPDTFGERLVGAGFTNVRIDVEPTAFRFLCRRPTEAKAQRAGPRGARPGDRSVDGAGNGQPSASPVPELK